MTNKVIAVCLMQLVIFNANAQEKNIDTSGYATEQNTKDEKSYSIGEIKTSYVGDTIIERSQYNEIVYPRKLVKPNSDINISLETAFGQKAGSEVIKSDRYYEIENTLSIKNKNYYVINPYRSNFSLLDQTVTKKSNIEILINTDGTFGDYIKWNGSITKIDGLSWNWKISPSDIVFTFSDHVVVDKKSYSSRNIAFLGLKGNQIKFRYIEKKYSDENLVSIDPIEISVENNNMIQVRNYKIQVIKITENDITYKVISD